jgi:hypothetical protein
MHVQLPTGTVIDTLYGHRALGGGPPALADGASSHKR